MMNFRSEPRPSALNALELFQDPVVALDLLCMDEILIKVRLGLTFSLILLGSPKLGEILLAGGKWGLRARIA